MVKPIQHLINSIGYKPTLIASGGISLGGAGISSAFIFIGVLALLTSQGVPLPGAFASLGNLHLVGGILFTAAGPVGLLSSSAFFIFMAQQVRTSLSRPVIIHTKRMEEVEKEEELAPSKEMPVERIRSYFDTVSVDVNAAQELKAVQELTLQTDFLLIFNDELKTAIDHIDVVDFRYQSTIGCISIWTDQRIYLDLRYTVNREKKKIVFGRGGAYEPRLVLKNITKLQLLKGLCKYITVEYPGVEAELRPNDTIILDLKKYKLKQEEENA